MKKRMMKGVAILCCCSLLMPTTVMAGKNVVINTEISEESIITPRIAVSERVTFSKNYTNYYSIPQSMSYPYYIPTYHISMHGTVYLQSVQKQGSIWIATYSGIVSGSI